MDHPVFIGEYFLVFPGAKGICADTRKPDGLLLIG